MHKIMLIGALTFMPTLVYADATVSGQWEADLDASHKIDMDILADGHWYSKNIEDDTVVRELSGTYKQIVRTSTTGELTFTPDKSAIEDNVDAKVEVDIYQLSKDHKTLLLTTDGDTMEYKKQNIEE
jgi:hypothetical protein